MKKNQRHKLFWEEKFLASLKMHGVVSAACLDAGIDRTTAYKAKDRDSEFAERWQDTLEQACDVLEFEAKKRALSHSDSLMMFLLRAHRPEKYLDKVAANLKIKPPKPLEEMTEAELDRYEQDLQGHADAR